MVSPKAQGYLEKSAAEIQKHLAEILKQREEAELKIETQKQLTKEEQEHVIQSITAFFKQ